MSAATAAILKLRARGHCVSAISAITSIPAGDLDGKHHPCPKRCSPDAGGEDRFRALNDVAETGGVSCNRCHPLEPGKIHDIFATIQWWFGCGFSESVSKVAAYFGMDTPANGHTRTGDATDDLTDEEFLRHVCTLKSMPVQSAIAYGAKVVRRGRRRAVVFPMVDETGKHCGKYSIYSDGTGINDNEKEVGLFVKHDGDGNPILPKPGDRVTLHEGVKDACASDSLDNQAIGLPGSSLNKKFARLFYGVHLDFVPDLDEISRKGATATAAVVQGIAASFRLVRLPGKITENHGRDLRDILREKNGEKLVRQAFADAKSPAEIESADAPEYTPFPIDELPDPLATFVAKGANALKCDPAYIVLPALAAIASTIGNSRRIQLKKSWCEPSVLWCGCVGESGSMKSPALDLALEPIRKRQSSAWRRYKVESEQYERDQQIHEADLVDWKKSGRKAGEPAPTAPEPPIAERFIVEDTTVEALAQILSEQQQPRGLLAARDELAGWINGFDAYKSSRGADVAHWLSVHRAGSLVKDRVGGRKAIRVPRAAVSITGGIQPTTLVLALSGRQTGEEKKPDAEHIANGLAARLLLAMPPRMPKEWTDDDLDDDIRTSMQSLIDRLAALELYVDEHGEPLPIDLPLSLPAKKRFISFYNEHAQEQVALPGDLAAVWSKTEGYAARLALVFQLIRNPDSAYVDEQSVASGIAVARWFSDEASRIYAILGREMEPEESREDRDRKRLIEWIQQRGGAVAVREVRAGNRRYRDGEEAEQALIALVEAGLGKWEFVPTTDRGGRPTRVFKLAAVIETNSLPQENDGFGFVDSVDGIEREKSQEVEGEREGSIANHLHQYPFQSANSSLYADKPVNETKTPLSGGSNEGFVDRHPRFSTNPPPTNGHARPGRELIEI